MINAWGWTWRDIMETPAEVLEMLWAIEREMRQPITIAEDEDSG